MKCARSTTASFQRLFRIQSFRSVAKVVRVTVPALFLSASLSYPLHAQSSCSVASTGNLAALNGWVPAPNDAWHQDISGAAVDPNSSTIVSAPQDLNGAYLHPDFSTPADGAAGIPYTVVDTGANPIPLVSVAASDPYDSDNTLYPFFASMPIEGNPSQCWSDGADHHAIVIDKNGCVAYEVYQANLCNGSWSSYGNIVWDFTTTEQRPYGMSSTDAAGLSVFEGLIRYDEIVAGQINHAIRFTAMHTKDDNALGYFTAPAVHAAGNLWGTDNIMGMRIRLKASYDVSGFSSTNQIILNAMKKYGMMLADNGGNMFFQGTPDPRWDDNDLNALKTVPATAFEVVKIGAVYDANTAPTGPAPVINSFTPSSSTVSPGSSVTLNSNVTNGSYQFIDAAGFTRGSITVKPTQTTTYTLYARNQYGTSTASTTVTVSANSSTPSLNFAAIPAQTYGVSPFVVSASSNSSGAITYSVVSGPATISGNVVAVTGVGTVTLQASQAATGSYTSATATTSFVVNGQTPTISFASIASKTVGAAPFTVSASSNSSGAITYAVVSGPATISGNTVTVTNAGTVTLLASQAASGTYTAGTATTSFTVASASTTTLTFAAIPAQTYGATVQVSATSNSPGAITYSVVSGPATIAGNTVTVNGTGTITVGASQAASASYAAATATTSFTANPAAPKLSFSAVASVSTGAAPFAVSATSNSAGAITYSVVSGPATIAGNIVSVTSAGTVTLQASQAANGNYTTATATTSFTVNPSTASSGLTFASVPAQTYGASFQVSATSKSPGAITYGVVSGPATIAGNTVTVTGTGTVTLQASQAGTAAYAASTATTSFVANPAVPKLSFSPVASVSTGAAPFAVSATSNSAGAITYAVVSGPATISGNTVTVTGAGTVTVVATQAATSNYTGAQVTATITVVGSTTRPNLSVSVVRTKTAYVAVTSSNSPGAITVSVVSGPAHVAGNNTVVVTGTGTITVMATQAASGNYSSATARASFN